MKNEREDHEEFDLLPVPKAPASDLVLHYPSHNVVVMSMSLIVADFVSILGPQLHKNMKRVYSRIGPYEGNFHIPQSFAAVIFNMGTERKWNTEEEVACLLGAWRRRQYSYSYALVVPPLKLTWRPLQGEGEVHYSFDYRVYTEAGRLQSDGRGYVE